MRILISGGTGLIDSKLVARLARGVAASIRRVILKVTELPGAYGPVELIAEEVR